MLRILMIFLIGACNTGSGPGLVIGLSLGSLVEHNTKTLVNQASVFFCHKVCLNFK